MEKKGNRSLQPSSRALATDSKKNQDVSGKAWPRNGRRREPTNGSLGVKAESTRKPPPQRLRASDKRPRARGYYSGGGGGGGLDRNETSELMHEPLEAELGSVFVPGSKKQSLNHLLNFRYQSPAESRYGSVASDYGGGRHALSKKHKYNKEHFLQANCQFVVKKSGDYKQYMNNPDALVDWNLIEQVHVQVSEYPACPICLFSPVAAKITRCGHIYCWSCILHYLALTDKAWRKCPICYESVYKQDLKSVVAIPHQTFNVNETITFKLMKRQRGSLIAYPADAEVKDEGVMFDVSDIASRDIHSKLLMAGHTDIMSIISREQRELDEQLNEDENAPERCFIEEAIRMLKEREGRTLEDKEEVQDIVEESAENDIEDKLAEISLDCDNSIISNVSEEQTVAVTSGQPAKFHYFYQASDGQHIYLHSINAHMLEHTYGSLEFGPKTITGRIMEKEGGSMTEELRKRLRYLAHLPVTCQFEVAEIQLRHPVVTKETLQHFQEQIDKRKKWRQQRARDEKRREKKIAEEENRKMGRYPAANIHLESHSQFPDFGEYEPTLGRQRSESENTLPSEPDSTSEASSSLGNVYAGPSFATMLATERKKPIWPGLKSAGPVEVPKLISVTGREMTASMAAKTGCDDGELEGFERMESLNRNFGDAIAQALKKAEVVDEESTTSGKKKKKKSKQKVLFTTNVAISGN